MTEKKRVYLQPLPVRIWHWVQALCIIVLIITGAQIRFPDHLSGLGSYKMAIYLHYATGILLIASVVLWLVYYTFVSRTMGLIYFPRGKDLKGLIGQTAFYAFYYFKGGDHPHHSKPGDKFNPLQKLFYWAIMFGLMPLICVSGVLLIFVDPLRAFLDSIGGLKMVAGVHFVLGACFAAFLPTHIYLTTLGDTPGRHIKTMFTGWEDE